MKPMKPMEPMTPMEPMKPLSENAAERWWPESLGASPDSAGGQNDVRYAYFGERQRLAVDTGGHVQVYATGEHRITGVRQGQGGGSGKLVFTSQRGEVSLDELLAADA